MIPAGIGTTVILFATAPSNTSCSVLDVPFNARPTPGFLSWVIILYSSADPSHEPVTINPSTMSKGPAAYRFIAALPVLNGISTIVPSSPKPTLNNARLMFIEKFSCISFGVRLICTHRFGGYASRCIIRYKTTSTFII